MRNTFVLKIFFIISLTIFIIGLMYVKVLASTKYNIKGYATDENGNGISNIQVEMIGKKGSYNATTDDNGLYQIENVEKGNDYKICYKYNNSYNIKDIVCKEYENYDGNLELGFIYSNEQNFNDKIQNIIDETDNIVQGQYRSFQNAHNPGELSFNIDQLEKDSSNEKAFHKIGIKDWRSIVVIISNYTKESLQTYFNRHFTMNTNLYRLSSQSNSSSKEQIIDDIYRNLKDKEPIVNSIYDESKQERGMAYTKDINIDKNKTINAIFTKNEEGQQQDNNDNNNQNNNSGDIPQNTIFLDNGKANFVTGYALKDNGEKLKNVLVKLENVQDEAKKAYTKTDENGYYSFGYPSEGIYQVKFEFKDKEVNGQYYEITDDCININNCNDISKNVISQVNSNINDIKSNFKDGITNETDKIDGELDSNVNNKCTLYGWTDKFQVESSYKSDIDGDGIEDTTIYPTNNKYSTAILKEREKFSLTIEEKINNMKFTLSNGQNLISWNYDNNHGENVNHVIDLGKSMNIEVTDDLQYGSTLYLEYAITVTNNSNIDCMGFTLLSNYIGMDFNENQKLMSINGTNKDCGWQSISKDDVISKYNDSVSNDNFLCNNVGELNKGESKTIYLAFSRVLSSEDDDYNFENTVELVEYKNNDGRRNYNIAGEIIRAGNYKYGTDGEILNKQEEDDDVSGYVGITPPTGIVKKSFCVLICNIITILMIIIIINILKKRKNKVDY